MNDIKEYIHKKEIEFATAEKMLEKESKHLVELNKDLLDINEAQELIQETAQQIQQKIHSQISAVVSRCLQAVFDEPYKFNIHFEQKRGQTEARLSFSRKGKELDPMTASGGGVLDVASFALRVACILLSSEELRRVLVMDEPFKFVSEDLHGRVREMLEELSKDMGIQFIMVTHIEELKTGKIIEIK